MMDNPDEQLRVLEETVRHYGLTSLQPTLRACLALVSGGPIDVAVIGQFKSGKSSLLNAVLGENLLPVGVLPATAVITRVSAGDSPRVLITFEDGSTEETSVGRLADFVTEVGNPLNIRRVAVVDVFIPALLAWPGVRLVDTPGLGSVFAHNTETTQSWMPNIAVAFITVSAERPYSDQDRQLVAEALATAPRVVVVLTKIDLLTNTEGVEVTEFVRNRLNETFGTAIPVVQFSTRFEPEKSASSLRETILRPIAETVATQRRDALAIKLSHLFNACRSYLSISLEAARRAENERNQLLAAVFTESVESSIIREELQLAKQSVCGGIREAFRRSFFAQRNDLESRIVERLQSALPTWSGNLATQARRYEAWMSEQLIAELTPLSLSAVPIAFELVSQAETRFSRIAEAFRDRLSRNITQSTGVEVSPVSWEACLPRLTVVPIALSQTFMTHWDLLWWMLPMSLVGSFFRRHILRRVPWEVEKNLFRLTSDWSTLIESAVDGLRSQAVDWVENEIATFRQLLERSQSEAEPIQFVLKQLNDAGGNHCDAAQSSDDSRRFDDISRKKQ